MTHALPPLPYGPAELEPHIDARTMILHHDRHHASYVENLNLALAGYPELHGRSAIWLLLNLRRLPRAIRVSVRHNAGGHVNHSLFWRALTPPKNCVAVEGRLEAAIVRDFGSVDRFKTRFMEAGATLFGSGWVWLARTQNDGGTLKIYVTPGHDNPMLRGHFPILVNDVWEHAYYLQYENRRKDYLQAWWSIVNWPEASRRFESSDRSAEMDWEDEGGVTLTSRAASAAGSDAFLPHGNAALPGSNR